MMINADELVQQFLDGDLDVSEEADALRRIAEDPEARALLRFDRRVQEVIVDGSPDHKVVPPGFTDRVMHAVTRLETAANVSSWQRLRSAWNALVQPRPLMWRPAYALPILALMVGILFFFGRAGSTDLAPPETFVSASETEKPVLVRFMFVNEDASTVAVAGDFTYWEPEPLTRQEVDGQSVWTTQVAVPAGEHRYMFVIDGERWVTDPLAPEARDDGFGHQNAILSL